MPECKIKLKNCPFCGTVPYVCYNSDGYAVVCLHTSAADPDLCVAAPMTLPYSTHEDAVKEWNSRKAETGRGWHVNAWAVREMYLLAARLFDIVKFYQGRLTQDQSMSVAVWDIEKELGDTGKRLQELRDQLNTKGRNLVH